MAESTEEYNEKNKRVKKTADINQYMNKYMKEYRQRNLEYARKRERENYHRNKYKSVLTSEEIESYRENLDEAYKYKKEILKNQTLLLNLLK